MSDDPSVRHAQSTERISDRLNRELELLQPFNGLAFTLPVSETGGIDPAAIRDYIASNGQSDA